MCLVLTAEARPNGRLAGACPPSVDGAEAQARASRRAWPRSKTPCRGRGRAGPGGPPGGPEVELSPSIPPPGATRAGPPTRQARRSRGELRPASANGEEGRTLKRCQTPGLAAFDHPTTGAGDCEARPNRHLNTASAGFYRFGLPNKPKAGPGRPDRTSGLEGPANRKKAKPAELCTPLVRRNRDEPSVSSRKKIS